MEVSMSVKFRQKIYAAPNFNLSYSPSSTTSNNNVTYSYNNSNSNTFANVNASNSVGKVSTTPTTATTSTTNNKTPQLLQNPNIQQPTVPNASPTPSPGSGKAPTGFMGYINNFRDKVKNSVKDRVAISKNTLNELKSGKERSNIEYNREVSGKSWVGSTSRFLADKSADSVSLAAKAIPIVNTASSIITGQPLIDPALAMGVGIGASVVDGIVTPLAKHAVNNYVKKKEESRANLQAVKKTYGDGWRNVPYNLIMGSKSVSRVGANLLGFNPNKKKIANAIKVTDGLRKTYNSMKPHVAPHLNSAIQAAYLGFNSLI